MSDWVFQLCDLNGNAISNITRSARDRTFQFRINSLTGLTIRLISDDSAINGTHSDGFPILDSGRRTIKAFRRELQPDNSYARVLKFFGPIWQIQDAGQQDNAFTAVLAYDAPVYLTKRFTGSIRSFTNVDAGQIAKTLIDEANAVASTGLYVSSVETTMSRSVTYQYKQLSEAISEFANSFNGFDWKFTPEDRTDGTFGNIRILAQLGSIKANALFGWGTAPHNVQSMDRKTDMSIVASDLTTIGGANQGGDQIVSIASNPATSQFFRRMEHVNPGFADVTDPGFLAALTADELNFRTLQRELVQFLPTPGSSPSFLDDYNVGDFVQVQAGTKLRGGFVGFQRVVGVDLIIDDVGREIVAGVFLIKEA